MAKKAKAGFTLLELIVVVTLIALMASIVAPRLVRQYEGAGERGDLRRLISFLRTAKETAITRGEIVTVRVDVEGRMTMEGERDNAPLGSRGPLSGYSLADRQTGGSSSGGDDLLIFFYPDGSTNGGVLTYEYQRTGERLVVEVDDRTGSVRARRGDAEVAQEVRWRAGDHEKRL